MLTGNDRINSAALLQEILKDISFRPSCVDFQWEWEVEPTYRFVAGATFELRGWLVRTTFRRPDTATGLIGTGHGRWELIEVGTSVSGVVKTCWLLVDLITRHELMEAFSFRGVRVFDPHKSVDDLCSTRKDGT